VGIPIYQVDAFTGVPFHGNPAGVCILQKAGDENWMQAVAAEMNLSETAFLLGQDDGYSLRWFTPTVEVEMCGHATLASAHILWETGLLPAQDTARFHTLSGLLTAARIGDEIELNFPESHPEKVDAPSGLEDALGVNPVFVGRTRIDYLVEVASDEEVRKMNPDFARLKDLSIRGVIVTSSDASGDYDFISRFFAPGAGIDEDPVTGSAHCCLGPFWSERLHKNEMTAYQASKRGGVVKLRIKDGRVHLAGKAVTVFRAELVVP
jgi:PhzF family phenazine biosynthesis protein